MYRTFSRALGLAALAACAAAAATLDGAEFYSNESVKFGRWEIRMQVAATPGSVSSFFTYYDKSSNGLPEPWREIDIEILGKNGSGFQSNLITGNASAKTTSEAFHATAADLSKSFHTYVVDWTPDSIVYRIDGKTVRNDPASNQQVKDLADHPQSYRMNIWASTSAGWVGTLDPAKLPIAQTVNWIAYSSYTPGRGPNGSNFTPQWTDDFGSLNTQRWARGNWTFDGNMADFTPNNAVVSNGYLMLILSKKGGPTNLTPPADPVGNNYTPTAIGPEAAPARFAVRASAGRLRIEAGDRAAEVTVAALDGRILARGKGPGPVEFGGLPRGVALVRVSGEARLVSLP